MNESIENDCNCGAYPALHPMGLVGCNIEGLCDQACSHCYQNCDTAEMNIGVGGNEYCGSTDFNIEKIKVSACCAEKIINPETGLEIPDHKLKKINYERNER